jgi:hypothetical protein
MRIPGFTAEAALERANESYRLALTAAAKQGVIPQSCQRNESGNFTCCDWIPLWRGGFFWCRTLIVYEVPLDS